MPLLSDAASSVDKEETPTDQQSRSPGQQIAKRRGVRAKTSAQEVRDAAKQAHRAKAKAKAEALKKAPVFTHL